MRDFFLNLINEITIENIQSKPIINEKFKFDKLGWYFFISPTSGIIKIRVVKRKTIINESISRFLNFKLLIIIGCENQSDFYKLYKFAGNNLDILNQLQKRAIEAVGKAKYK